jgi:hypothetical protein
VSIDLSLFLFLYLFLSSLPFSFFPVFSVPNGHCFKDNVSKKLRCSECKLAPYRGKFWVPMCTESHLTAELIFYTVGRPQSCEQELGRVTPAIAYLVCGNILQRSVYPLADVEETKLFACGYKISGRWLMTTPSVPTIALWWLQASCTDYCCVVVTGPLYWLLLCSGYRPVVLTIAV